MTMDASSSEIEYLAGQLIKEELPVTYHTLARKLSIHTSSAKTVLSEFYEKNKEKLNASFIITGRSESGQLIKLSANEESLNEDVKKFVSVHTVHVYCLTPKQNEFTNYSIAFEELKFPTSFDNAEEYYENGMIRGPPVKEVVRAPTADIKREASRAPSVSNAASKPTTPSETTTKAKVKSAGLTSGYVSRKQSAKPAATLSNYKSRKEENVGAKRQATSTGGYQYKSRKTEAAAPKERVIVSSVDEGDQGIEDRPLPKANSEELAKMFDDDDFSDFGDDDDAGEKDSPVQEPEAEEEKQPHTVQEMFVPEEEEEEAKPDDASREASRAPSEPPKEDTVDEDGFVVTYRKAKDNQKGSAPVRKATKPNHKPKSAKPSKNDGKKKQSSLMSFFSK